MNHELNQLFVFKAIERSPDKPLIHKIEYGGDVAVQAIHRSKRVRCCELAACFHVTAPLIPRLCSLIVLRSHRCPVPRQQFIQPIDLVIVDAVEDVSEIGLWVETV